jgi:hypothetical protein
MNVHHLWGNATFRRKVHSCQLTEITNKKMKLKIAAHCPTACESTQLENASCKFVGLLQ